MESKAMVAVQESWPVSGASLPVGEPVTLVIEDERFFGWVAPEAQAHSLVCVAIEFTRGGTRVRERIPVENIQRLRDYLQAHPEFTPGEGARSVHHAFTNDTMLKEGDVREPCACSFDHERCACSSPQMASSSHRVSPPCG
jgi:hypothetical protein